MTRIMLEMNMGYDKACQLLLIVSFVCMFTDSSLQSRELKIIEPEPGKPMTERIITKMSSFN